MYTQNLGRASSFRGFPCVSQTIFSFCFYLGRPMRGSRQTPSSTPVGKKASHGTPTNVALSEIIDSSTVLESWNHTTAHPIGALLKEFASRIIMLFEIGVDTGAEFSTYWTTMVQVRAGEFAPAIAGLGSLFDFVAQRIHLIESSSQTHNNALVSASKAETLRVKSSEQLTAMINKVQRTLDQVLTDGLVRTAETHAALSDCLQDVQVVSDVQLTNVGLPKAALDPVMSKLRDGIAAASQTPRQSSPGRNAVPHRTNRITEPSTAQSARTPKSRQRDSPIKQPHPSLPAIPTDSKLVKSQQLTLDLELRVAAPPFSLPAKFDIEGFEAEAFNRNRHKSWLRSVGGSTIRRADSEPAARLIPTTLIRDSAEDSPRKPLAREDREVMFRLKQVREEILGDTELTFVGTKSLQ
jgi:hypothetical protein